MPSGLTSKFNILKQSPLDFEVSSLTALVETSEPRWAPSRYNIRSSTDDGRLVLWNSYTGTMSVFTAEQRPTVEAMLSRKGFAARKEGIVRYLFERGYLVKEGTDEYRRIQLGFGQQHYRNDALELILLASEDCNFRCEYCYEQFARGTMQSWVRTGVKNLVQKRLASLRSLSITWFGGEPLYGFAAIEDLAPYFLEIAREHSLRYSSNMTTNGYLLTPDVADKLLAWKINQFQITLDGPPEFHDRSRPTRNGEGTFDVIFENLKSISQRQDDFYIDIRVNFDRHNYPHLGEFLDLVETTFRGDRRFKMRFRAVGQWGGPNDANLQVCGVDESARVQLEMMAEARKRGLGLGDDIRRMPGLGGQVCYAARPYNYIVGSDGKLMKCTIDLDTKDRNIVGELKESGDLEIDFDKFALWTEPAFERDSKCQKCVVLPPCQGVYCPQVRMDTGDSPCSSLRMGAKKQLREAVANYAGRSRKAVITSAGVSYEAVNPVSDEQPS